MRPTIHALSPFVLLVTFASSAFGATPESTSVCELSANPGRFEGAEVSVHGSIYVGVDVTSIGDSHCPGVSIQLFVGSKAYGRKDVYAFERNVRKHGMQATAIVEGQFHAKASVFPYPMPAIDMHAIKNVVFAGK